MKRNPQTFSHLRRPESTRVETSLMHQGENTASVSIASRRAPEKAQQSLSGSRLTSGRPARITRLHFHSTCTVTHSAERVARTEPGVCSYFQHFSYVKEPGVGFLLWALFPRAPSSRPGTASGFEEDAPSPRCRKCGSQNVRELMKLGGPPCPRRKSERPVSIGAGAGCYSSAS